MSAEPIALPEIRWTWRRAYTYGVTVGGLLLLNVIINLLVTATAGAVQALLTIALALIVLIGVVGLVYLAGATVTDIRRLAVAVRDPSKETSR